MNDKSVVLYTAILFTFTLPAFIAVGSAGYIALASVPQVYTLMYLFITLMAATKWFGKGILTAAKESFGSVLRSNQQE